MEIKSLKDLKEFIKDLPDDMPVGLLDLTTDDFDLMNSKIEDIIIEDYVIEEGGETEGKALFICFENKFNENPI